MIQQTSRRAGFTLVEMLVSSALIIFMMYVIASAFESGLTSFRVLKAQGDMQEKLRAAASIIRLDLTTPHFGGAMSPNNQGPFLADQLLNNQSWQPPQKGYFRISMPGPGPQRPVVGIAEGLDPDSANPATYYRLDPAAVRNMYLQFTVNLTDGHPQVRDARGRRDQFFQTNSAGLWLRPSPKPPPLTITDSLNAFSLPDYNQNQGATFRRSDGSIGFSDFTSYWAEVWLFAKPNGRFADAAQTVPLYDLYRRQMLLVEPVPPASYPAQHASTAAPADVSWWLSGAMIQQTSSPFAPFNGAADVTEPLRRWGMLSPASGGGVYGQPASSPFPTVLEEDVAYNASQGNAAANPYADPRVGGDLLLTDVVNFDIKAYWEPVRLGAPNTERFASPNAVAGDYAEPSPVNNPDYPFDRLPPGINPGFLKSDPANNGYTVRVFDTWSSNREVSPPGANPTYDYNYGPPPSSGTTLMQGSQSTMLQQELGAWNVGHFTPIPGLTPNTQGAPKTDPNAVIPLRVRVRAVQIKLRIWDQKSGQTRQMTIIQDV